jgi:hypothetical protein
MSGNPSDAAPKSAYEVSEAPFEVSEHTGPQADAVVEGEADNEEITRRQEAILASTYDQSLAKSGKSDEEIDKQNHDQALLAAGAAIVTGVIAAHQAAGHHQGEDDSASPPDAHHGEGGDHSG